MGFISTLLTGPIGGYIKMGLIAAGIGLAVYGLKTYNQYQANEMAEAQALLDATQLAQRESSRADAAESALAQERLTTAALQKSVAEAREAVRLVNVKFTEFRDTADEQIAVLLEHDLDSIFAGKGSLFIRLANRATEARFKQVEGIFDGS